LEADHPDTRALSERVACAVEVVNRIVANEQDGVVRSLTADKGYFAIEEIAQIQEFDIRTVIGDAHAARRRKEALAAPLRNALRRAACAVKSQSGKALLRQRGMHLERSFEHVLDEGGLRRATLKGTENLAKRYKIAAACFNLSLLMRALLGVGTPKHRTYYYSQAFAPDVKPQQMYGYRLHDPRSGAFCRRVAREYCVSRVMNLKRAGRFRKYREGEAGLPRQGFAIGDGC
jgi:transposase